MKMTEKFVAISEETTKIFMKAKRYQFDRFIKIYCPAANELGIFRLDKKLKQKMSPQTLKQDLAFLVE